MTGNRHGRRKKDRHAGRVLAVAATLVFAVFFAGFLVIFFARRGAERTPEEVPPAAAVQVQKTEDAVPFTAISVPETEETDTETAGEGDEEETAQDAAERLLKDMTPEEKVAQLFIVTPEQLTGYELVTQCGEATFAALDRYPVCGLIYFSKNLESAEQTAQMIKTAKEYALEKTGIPLFAAVDEEGGRVARVADAGFGYEKTPPMRTLAAQGEDAVHEAGAYIGSYLEALGFNLDFAPVADVLTNPANTAIGDRAFGDDPHTVAKMADAFAKGLAEHGVLAVYKHFPGHGGTADDTHDGYAWLPRTKDELKETELVPFADGIGKQVPMIMTAHIALPEAMGDDLPVTLSRAVVTGILREEMGYRGVVVTDALNMGAIAVRYSAAESAVMALQAGCDILLMPADFPAAYDAVLLAVNNGTIPQETLDRAVLRILTLKQTLMPDAENG